jgi:hypothetical protein
MTTQKLNVGSRCSAVKELNSRNTIILFVLLLLGCVPVILGKDVVQQVSSMYHLAESDNPYFVPQHLWTLYVFTPVVVLSAFLLFLTPGLFLSLALNSAENIRQWVLKGFALSLLTISVGAAVVQEIAGASLSGNAFIAVVIACSLICFGLLLFRLSRGAGIIWPLQQKYAGTTILIMLLAPMVLLVALTPKFFWENFNGDGAHAFESARLLLVRPLPFWPASAGEISSFPGINSMLFAFPASWFIRLFGQVEVSARLPFLLYLVVLYAAILALVEFDKSMPLPRAERCLIFLPLAVYASVMAYSATVNPYFSDIALPATQDTLLMVCFLGFILMFLMNRQKWASFFIFLTFCSVSNGSLLILLWLVSATFLWRPRPSGRLVLCALTLAGCFAISAVAPKVLAAVDYPVPGREHGAVELLKHFAFLQFTDWRRIAYILIPSAIVPALALVAWKWQGEIERSLTFMIAVYFLFFYVQAHISLHYFVPVMILPLLVFWRLYYLIKPRLRPFILAGTAVAGIVALLISLPRNFSPHTDGRLVGEQIEDRIGGYDEFDPSVFKRAEMFSEIFPYTWDPNVPCISYGGSPLIWNYYAQKACAKKRNINYIIQISTCPPSEKTKLVSEQDGVALYVLDESVWTRHRAIRPSSSVSRTFALPRGIIFRSVPLKSGPRILNVVKIIESFGFDMDPILDRLGVER